MGVFLSFKVGYILTWLAWLVPDWCRLIHMVWLPITTTKFAFIFVILRLSAPLTSWWHYSSPHSVSSPFLPLALSIPFPAHLTSLSISLPPPEPAQFHHLHLFIPFFLFVFLFTILLRPLFSSLCGWTHLDVPPDFGWSWMRRNDKKNKNLDMNKVY